MTGSLHCGIYRCSVTDMHMCPCTVDGCECVYVTVSKPFVIPIFNETTFIKMVIYLRMGTCVFCSILLNVKLPLDKNLTNFIR